MLEVYINVKVYVSVFSGCMAYIRSHHQPLSRVTWKKGLYRCGPEEQPVELSVLFWKLVKLFISLILCQDSARMG